jgi:hypothetical protein
MSDRRKREIRKLMAETGMNYTRAAREVERQRLAAASLAVGSTEPSLAAANITAEELRQQVAMIGESSWVLAEMADVARIAQEHRQQMADVARVTQEHRQMPDVARITQEHRQQMADVARATQQHRQQMADVARITQEHRQQMADVARATQQHRQQMADVARAADIAKVRFTPPTW